MAAHEGYPSPAERSSQGTALLQAADEHVRGPELVGDIPHRHVGPHQPRQVEDRLQPHASYAKWDHRRGVAMADRHHIRSGRIDGAVNRALGVGWARVAVQLPPVQREALEVGLGDQLWPELASDVMLAGIGRIADADVAERVED